MSGSAAPRFTPQSGSAAPGSIQPGSIQPGSIQPGSIPAIALGSTAVIWVLLYVVMLPGWGASEWFAGAVTGAGLLGAGFIAGRCSGGSAMRAGALTGVAMGVLNLLIMGGLIGGEIRAVLGPAAGWGALALAASSALGMAGAMVARRADDSRPLNWSAVLALVTAGATFALLAAGGVVTGREAGMAVRGWLMPEGYPLVLFPLRLMRADPGVYVEHAHRLLGLLVGLCAISLVAHLWRHDRGRGVRWLATIVLGAVIVQGALGGTRVTEDSVVLAIAHGIFGQMIFAAMVLIAIAVIQPPGALEGVDAKPAREGRRAMSLTHGLLLQLALGATYRHLSAEGSAPKGLMHGTLGLHLLLAIAIVILAIFVGGRASSRGAAWPLLRRAGRTMLLLVLLQVALGVAAVIAVFSAPEQGPEPIWQTAATTAHQANGALLLAMAAVITAWWRAIARARSR